MLHFSFISDLAQVKLKLKQNG